MAIVAESFLPEVNGVSNSVLRVLEHLRRTGHAATVIAPGHGPSEYDGAPVVRVPSLPLPMYRSFPIALPTRRVDAALRDFAPDVVHLASPAAIGALGATAAEKLDIPAVAVFQSDLAGFASRYRLGFTGPALWRWLRRIHTKTALTLVPSSPTAWELESHGITPVARWGRGVDFDHFHPRHRNERLRRNLAPRGEVIVGYVGRLAKEKQVHQLAHLDGLPGCRLVIVGDGPARRSLQRRLPNARFLGFRRGLALSRAIASLDVFVHPGEHETFCQAVQEALAAGVPVVAPAAGGPLDLVRHGTTGFLVPPGAPELFRGAVHSLVEDGALRRAMGDAAHSSVADRTWPLLGDELLAHYRSVTNTRPRLMEVRAA